MRYKDQATTIFSEIASIIESSDNAENNIYDIVDFMIGIMTKDQLNQVEDMLTNTQRRLKCYFQTQFHSTTYHNPQY